MVSPKQRMLNAYRGIYSDHYPVNPEFWSYYPAKILGLNLVEYELEVPMWKGILAATKYFDGDGWAIASGDSHYPDIEITSVFESIGNDRYREQKMINCDGLNLECSNVYAKTDPAWVETYPVKDIADLDKYIRAKLSDRVVYDFTKANDAHAQAGEEILVELDIGAAFTDVFADAMGYEETIMLFMSGEDKKLQEYFELFLNQKIELIQQVAEKTEYEVLFIGSNISNCSLIGPTLWKKWDKPYHMEIVKEAHRLGKLVHHHNHGKVMEIVSDFVDIGFDCVCPFERPPGDVDGLQGLKKVRQLLDDKVTFNGNVHTINTMIFGNTDDVRREVREIKEAFKDTPRLVIGTGDQVTDETPEENIFAMIDEGRRR